MWKTWLSNKKGVELWVKEPWNEIWLCHYDLFLDKTLYFPSASLSPTV